MAMITIFILMYIKKWLLWQIYLKPNDKHHFVDYEKQMKYVFLYHLYLWKTIASNILYSPRHQINNLSLCWFFCTNINQSTFYFKISTLFMYKNFHKTHNNGSYLTLYLQLIINVNYNVESWYRPSFKHGVVQLFTHIL